MAIDPNNRNKQRLADLIPGKAPSPVAMNELGRAHGMDPKLRGPVGAGLAATAAAPLGALAMAHPVAATGIAATTAGVPVATSYTDDGKKPEGPQGRGLDLIQRARDTGRSLRDFGNTVYEKTKPIAERQAASPAMPAGVKNSSVGGIYEGRGEFGERAFSNNAADPILQGKSAGRGGFAGSLKDIPGAKGVDTTDSKAMVDMYRQTSQIYRDTSNRSLGVDDGSAARRGNGGLSLKDVLRSEDKRLDREQQAQLAAERLAFDKLRAEQDAKKVEATIGGQNTRAGEKLDAGKLAEIDKVVNERLSQLPEGANERDRLLAELSALESYDMNFDSTPRGKSARNRFAQLQANRLGSTPTSGESFWRNDPGNDKPYFGEDTDFATFNNLQVSKPGFGETLKDIFAGPFYSPSPVQAVNKDGEKIRRSEDELENYSDAELEWLKKFSERDTARANRKK